MKRNIRELAQQEYDLLIIGGGVYGVASAWDAALRGLKVALLERNDFGWSTSSNSSKIAHSGARYLQHADYKRMRESIRERSLVADVAPHLIDQQPFVMPIYGHGMKGRETMGVYFSVYDLLSADLRQKKDPFRVAPNSQLLSKEELLRIMPDIEQEGLTGGMVWSEGQMHNTERFLLARVLSAAERGAQFANHTEVVGFLGSDKSVSGVEAKDLVTGEVLQIRAKVVLNASGPWVIKTLGLSKANVNLDRGIHASKAFSFITRSLCDDHALVISHRPIYEDKYAIVNKKSNLSFAIPWRGHSIIGSLHLPCDDDPEKVTISEEEIQAYIDLLNDGCPPTKLRREDILHILWGIVPADKQGSAAPLKHYQLLDHSKEDGLDGLVSLVGVKYTTARDVAQKAVDLVFKKLNRRAPESLTHKTPVWGGEIAYMEQFMDRALAKESHRFSADVIRHLVRTYGSEYPRVLSYLEENPAWQEAIADSDVLQVEVIYAVREEMAEKLADVVLRRTDLGSLYYPGDKPARQCAQLMAQELGWNEERIDAEIQALKEYYLVLPVRESQVCV